MQRDSNLPTGAQLDGCNCLTLRRAARRVTQRYDAALAPSGVKATQFPLLARLGGSPAGLGVLARELGMDRTTLGHNVRPMLAKGWVEMRPGTDRRVRLLALSAAGEAVLRAAMPLWGRAQADFEAAFGAERAAALRGELGAVARV